MLKISVKNQQQQKSGDAQSHFVLHHLSTALFLIPVVCGLSFSVMLSFPLNWSWWVCIGKCTLSLFLGTQCNSIVLFHTQPLLPYCPTGYNLEPDTPTQTHKQPSLLIAASRLTMTLVWSVVMMPQGHSLLPPPPPFPLLTASHTLACPLAPCSCYPLPVPLCSVLVNICLSL